ncbi:hypothetical protein VE04_07251 [Pseudogymnoascus sp. 24MN13]|nr:hypothetical protein VE04_07251 [Pseudogymnoascus sp. 24MN13]
MVSIPQPPAAAQPTQEIKLAAASATNTAMPTTTSTLSGTWSPSSWTTKPIKQNAIDASGPAVERVLANLSRLPPLVTPNEIENLKAKLRDVAQGNAFLLQGGDCAELFDYCQDGAIESKIKLLLQMSLVLISGCNKPVVRIARMAGQYAKPRSSPMEMVDGKEIPSFRGDILNGFDVGERDLDPERLKSAYFHSAATLNFVRASLASGFADLHRPLDWGLGHVQDPELQAKYTKIVDSITGTLRMMRAVGVGAESSSGLQTVDLYTSHEGLLLEYEQSLTRKLPIPSETTSTVPAPETDSSTTGGKKAYYDTSAHFLWIGERTRQLDGAHVDFLSRVANPIGVKLGPTTSVTDLMALLRTLNPTCEVGKITLTTRYVASKVSELLPAHIRAVESRESKRGGAWQCDPMHGNTRSTPSGIKTRVFGDIFSELQKTLQVHKEEGSYLGGVHLELTGEAVTECMGGSEGLNEEDLGTNYTSYCDPRLNEKQALEMAFLIAGHYKGQEAL